MQGKRENSSDGVLELWGEVLIRSVAEEYTGEVIDDYVTEYGRVFTPTAA
jgi:hypothetical protein